MGVRLALVLSVFFFLVIRRPTRSPPLYSSAESDLYKGQEQDRARDVVEVAEALSKQLDCRIIVIGAGQNLSRIHISEPTRLRRTSYAVFGLKKKKKKLINTLDDNHNDLRYFFQNQFLVVVD